MTERERYKFLVVDDDVAMRETLAGRLTQLGYEPIVLKSAEHAINYLEATENGTQNHTKIAAIFCDLQMKGDSGEDKKAGLNVLTARNALDPDMPFYLISGKEGIQDETYTAGTYNASGFIRKKSLDDALKPILDRAILTPERFQSTICNYEENEHGILVPKYGGSTVNRHVYAGNPLEARNSPPLNVLDSLVGKQRYGYQVVAVPGGGPAKNQLEAIIDKGGKGCSGVKRIHETLVNGILEGNAKVVSAMFDTEDSEDVAEVVDLSQLHNLSHPSLSELVELNKPWVVPFAPRNLRLKYSAEMGFYIPKGDSDATSMLLAHLSGVPLILIKRTDGVYKFDPYRGRPEEGRNEEYHASEIHLWKKVQEANERLHSISYESFKEVDNEGFWDRKKGHLLEAASVELGAFLGVDTHILHVDPIELYPDGRHIIQRLNYWPEGMTSNEFRNKMFEYILSAYRRPDITSASRAPR